MTKTYKYKCKINKETYKNIENALYLCRYLYNGFLAERINAYRITKLFSIKREYYPNYYSQKKQLPFIKEIDERFKEIPSNILQDVCQRVDNSYKKFFTGAGFPKFKGKDFYRSFNMSYANGYKIDGYGSITLHTKQEKEGYEIKYPFLEISKIGKLKLLSFNKYKMQGVIQQVCIEVDNKGGVWAMFTCKNIQEKPFIQTNREVGIDIGVAKYVTMSDETYIENPKFLESLQKKKAKIERAMARKKLGSNGFNLNKIQLQNIHKKIANCRKDFQHKVTKDIVTSYDTIVCEKLKIKNMTKSSKGTKEKHGKNVKQKSGLNRSLLDGAFSQFYTILKYKAEEYGKRFIQVDPKYTSQTCSKCGYIDKNNRLSQSEFVCLKCGHTENADFNAAKNILKKGLNKLTS
jgi:putative transposase